MIFTRNLKRKKQMIMTQEDKAKAYDEALERARKWEGNPAAVDYIFPKIKESEDEKIRKELISFVRGFIECHDKPYAERDEKYESWLAWLEKQGEQKPKGKSALEAVKEEKVDNQNCVKPDKVEPKFKVGDWVVNKFGDVWHIDSFDKKNYQVSNGNEYNYFPISKQNEMHLWTIQDAKDGDVLVIESGRRNDKCLFIFKCRADREILEYCYYRCSSDTFSTTGSYIGYLDNIYHPATKEQRYLLFQKMVEAGYAWDDRQLKLIKIEQKPVKEIKSEEWRKELSLSLQIQAYLNTASDELYAKDKPLYSEKRIEDIHKCMKMWTKLHNFYFYNYSEQKPTYHKFRAGDVIRHIKQGFTCKIDSVDTEYRISKCNLGNHLPFEAEDYYELVEQKPEWSNEYKGLLEAQYQQGYEDGKKVHVNVEWSEEDESCINYILINCMHYAEECGHVEELHNDELHKQAKEWLKSLRHQNRWKPSDEQMEAMEDAICHCENDKMSYTSSVLKNLLEQLKKL
jgi:flavodoxin